MQSLSENLKFNLKEFERRFINIWQNTHPSQESVIEIDISKSENLKIGKYGAKTAS